MYTTINLQVTSPADLTQLTNQEVNIRYDYVLSEIYIDSTVRTYICDRASKKGPSGHKLYLIIKLYISLVLQNKFMLCKL